MLWAEQYFLGGVFRVFCFLDVQSRGCVSGGVLTQGGGQLSGAEQQCKVLTGITCQGRFGVKAHRPQHVPGEFFSHPVPPKRRRNLRGTRKASPGTQAPAPCHPYSRLLG